MAFVAFLPQHMAILASVNNDSLAFALIALILWQTVRYIKNDRVPVWRLGLLIGLAILTKTTAYFMGAVVLLAIILHWISSEEKSTTILLQKIAMLALAILPFALFWFGRNITVYGFPDIMGLRAHDAVVIGQKRTVELITEIGQSDYFSRAWQTTYNSFRGQFGWMAVPLDNLMYMFMDGLLFLALAGCFLAAFMSRLRPNLLQNPARRNVAITVFAMISLIIIMYIYYNTTFVQFQGRYLFGVLIPLGMTLAAGLSAWNRLFFKNSPVMAWFPFVTLIWLALLDAYLIWRVIPGALSPI